MKNHVLAAVLVVMLFVLGLWATVQSFRYFFTMRQLARLQNPVSQVTYRLNVAQSLVNEAMEYGKRNPAIDPILFSFHFKSSPASNAAMATTKPANK